jgi:hypothetical protein
LARLGEGWVFWSGIQLGLNTITMRVVRVARPKHLVEIKIQVLLIEEFEENLLDLEALDLGG